MLLKNVIPCIWSVTIHVTNQDIIQRYYDLPQTVGGFDIW